jgi:hypothetical protein
MANEAPEDLTRTHINLYTSDIEFLKLHMGYGWTTQVRELIREYVTALKTEIKVKPKKAKP